MRKVVRQIEVPYDRDEAGKPIMLLFEVLECGHRRRCYPTMRGLATFSEGENAPVPSSERSCTECS